MTSALTSTQYGYLRSNRHQVGTRVQVAPLTTVYTATIATISETTNGTTAQVTVSAVSGTYGNIKTGMTVFVSSTNDRTAWKWVGRVRITSTTPNLMINETNANLLEVGDYVFVVNDYRLFPKRPYYYNDTFFLDYNATYSPLAPLPTGVQSAYVSHTGSVTFTASAIAMAGGSISSYLWSFDDGSGTTNTATTTATFSDGFRYVSLTVTDNASTSHTLRIPVWTGTGNSISNLDGSIEITEEAGQGSQCRFVIVGTASLERGQLICVSAENETYGTTDTHIQSNIIFTGRVSEINLLTDYEDVTRERRYEVVALDAIGWMSQIEIPNFQLTNGATTAVGYLTNATPQRILWWVATQFSTLGSIVPIEFWSTGTTYLYNGESPLGGATLLNAFQYIAERVNAVIQPSASGNVAIVRDASMYESGRDALTTIATLTLADIRNRLSVTPRFYAHSSLGRIVVDAGSFNGTGYVVSHGLSAFVPNDLGQSEQSFSTQLLTYNLSQSNADAETATRAGNLLALLGERVTLSSDLRGGWWWVHPDMGAWYVWSIASSEFANGVGFSSERWQLTSVQKSFEPSSGLAVVSGSFVQESSGVSGIATAYSSVADVDFSPNETFDDGTTFPLPDDLTVLPDRILDWDTVTTGTDNGDGSVDGTCSGSSAVVVLETAVDDTRCITGIDITLDQSTATGVMWRSGLELNGAEIASGSFTVAGSQILLSKSFNYSNVKATTTTLTATPVASCTGSVRLRSFSVYYRECEENASNGESWCYTADFSASDGGWVAGSYSAASYVSGTGWGSASPDTDIVVIRKAFSPDATITEFSIITDTALSSGAFYAGVGVAYDDVNAYSIASSSTQWDKAIVATGAPFIELALDYQVGNRDPYSGHIISVIVRGMGTNPFGSSNC